MQIKTDYPEHPDKIVIRKNEFSPEVKEIDIWNYYDGIKNKLIPELKGRDLFVVVSPKTGQKIYIRHPYDKKTNFIRINNNDEFETYHSGRTVEYHRTSPVVTDEVVFDMDPGSAATFQEIKNVVQLCLDFIKSQKDFKVKTEIRYTGKRSFHITAYLKTKKKISEIKKEIEDRLKETFKDHKDIVIASNKPSGHKVNIDLSPMKENGGHVAPYSLRVETGLVCVLVSNLKNFEKDDAKLEKIYKQLTGKKFVWNNEKKAYLRVLQEINKFGRI